MNKVKICLWEIYYHQKKKKKKENEADKFKDVFGNLNLRLDKSINNITLFTSNKEDNLN